MHPQACQRLALHLMEPDSSLHSPQIGPSHRYDSTDLLTLPGTRYLILGQVTVSGNTNPCVQRGRRIVVRTFSAGRVKRSFLDETQCARYAEGSFPDI